VIYSVYTKGEEMAPREKERTRLACLPLADLIDEVERLQTLNAELLAACQASEVEYANLDENAVLEYRCPECNPVNAPTASLCAHHLRVAAIRRATATGPDANATRAVEQLDQQATRNARDAAEGRTNA
jgi:hypothetical protein